VDSLTTGIVVVVTVVVMVVGMAAAARRLLGANFGLVRLFLAGAIALLVAGPISQSLAPHTVLGDDSVVPLWFLLLSIACALLVAMILLVVAEALVPTGRVTPLLWARGLRARLARTRRYLQILTIAVRHGLGPYLRGRDPATAGSRSRLARSLRQALDAGGVTFVKLGQVLSTRRDLLPPEFVRELGALRDQAAPVPSDLIEEVLRRELGAPVDQLFARFDPEPLAAASVGQVHTARLLSGADVVVKVQRPGVRAVVERDLDIVRRLAATLHARTRWGRAAGLVDLADGFTRAIREELDFHVEARNIAAVRASVLDEKEVVLPEPHEALCTERVLVMRRLRGVPLAGARPVIAARGLEPADVARTLLFCVLRQIMIGGVFHADPHPGNVLLLEDGRLGLLDFGSVGRLDAAMRQALQRLLLGLDSGDPATVSDALLLIVNRPDEVDEERLERSLGQFMAQHLGPGAPAGAQMFVDLFQLITHYRLSVPPEVAAVFRSLATLEGALGDVAPGFNVVVEARGFAGRYLAEMLRPAALRQAAMDELTTLLPLLRRLPRRIDRIAGALERGRLNVNVRLLADERDRQHMMALLHRSLTTVIGGVAGIMAVMLLGIDDDPRVTDEVGLFDLFGYGLLVVAAVLGLRVLVAIFRTDHDSW
jgi:ubiquinone biosynthesis protein